MATELVHIGNFLQWGKLVKTWATGVDHVKNGNTYLPRPTTMESLATQCKLAGVGAKFPVRITKVHYVDDKELDKNLDTLIVRLANPKLIAEVEDELKGGADYRIPDFYRLTFRAARDPDMAEQEKLDFHDRRLGDYSIGNCM